MSDGRQSFLRRDGGLLRMSAGLLFGRVGSALVTATLLAVLARRLGPGSFGVFALTFSVSVFAAAVLDWGISATLTRDAAREGALVRAAVKLRTVTAVMVVVLGAVSGVLISGQLGAWPICLAASALAAGDHAAEVLQSWWTSRGLSLRASSFLIGRKLASLAVVSLGLAFVDTALLLVIVNLVVALLSFIVALRASDPQVRPTVPVRALVKRGRGFMLTSIGSQALSLDVLVVATVVSTQQAGIFAAASRIASPLTLIGASVGLAVLRDRSGGQPRRRLFRALVLITPVVMALLAAVPLGPMIVAVVLGSDFTSSVPVLQVLLVAVAASTVSQVLSAHLNANGRALTVGWLVVGIAPFGLALAGLGAATAGAVGAAAGALIVQIAFGTLLVVLVNRRRMP